jgi:methionine-S-sulfoxide reductase
MSPFAKHLLVSLRGWTRRTGLGGAWWTLGAISVACAALLVAVTAATEAAGRSKPPSSALDGANDSIVLGMGCFWGAEKRMSALPGVVNVEAGYANGDIEGSYEAVIAYESALRRGRAPGRNHAEVVRVVFDPTRVSLESVLIHFWESHDPTQGDRQGNDIGSNYRSAIYTRNEAQQAVALRTRDVYQDALTKHGYGLITTEIAPLKTYYPAEKYHQDYLKKNPRGYCGLGGTGVRYPLESGTRP